MPTAKQNVPSGWSLKAVDPELLKLAVPVGRGGRPRWATTMQKAALAIFDRARGGEVLGRLRCSAGKPSRRGSRSCANRSTEASAGAEAHGHSCCASWQTVGEPLARAVTHTWGALTHACRYHAYDLPPTAKELDAWLSSVALLAGDRPATMHLL